MNLLSRLLPYSDRTIHALCVKQTVAFIFRPEGALEINWSSRVMVFAPFQSGDERVEISCEAAVRERENKTGVLGNTIFFPTFNPCPY